MAIFIDCKINLQENSLNWCTSQVESGWVGFLVWICDIPIPKMQGNLITKPTGWAKKSCMISYTMEWLDPSINHLGEQAIPVTCILEYPWHCAAGCFSFTKGWHGTLVNFWCGDMARIDRLLKRFKEGMPFHTWQVGVYKTTLWQILIHPTFSILKNNSQSIFFSWTWLYVVFFFYRQSKLLIHVYS